LTFAAQVPGVCHLLPNAVQVAVFWLVQASVVLAFAVRFRWIYVVLWAASHFVRAIGLTLAFHRYFAHRAFRMHRGARFVWAFIGTAAMQKGPLWWAGHHVNHHRYADRDGDPHSPAVSGFYYAHIGWFLHDSKHDRLPPTNPVVRDFGTIPEIAWLDRYHFVPPLAWALTLFAAGGVPFVIWGFCVPTVTLAHATFAINTINHMFGSRRFQTRDLSRNNLITAFFAAGEGWHNNHHRYQRAARNGFYWWEFDPTWYVIRAMAAVGLVWGIQPVPQRIYAEARAVRDARRGPAAHDLIAPLPLDLAEELE
jgi:stearoyl-CoA desaturase (Delta-9 desaturase)